jgi:hypothetical protein
VSKSFEKIERNSSNGTKAEALNRPQLESKKAENLVESVLGNFIFQRLWKNQGNIKTHEHGSSLEHKLKPL